MEGGEVDLTLAINITKNKYFYDGQEITAEEYDSLLAEIKEKAAYVTNLFNGEITIADVPAEWQEEILLRVDERRRAATEEDELSAEEALDIILGGEGA